MHELSIAEAVVDIVERHAAGRAVTRVELSVGHLRQVVPAALEFAFMLLTDGTTLQGAELVIEEIPAQGRCRLCAQVSTMTEFPLQCSSCGGLDLEVLAGEELLVESVEVERELGREEEMTTEGMAHGC